MCRAEVKSFYRKAVLLLFGKTLLALLFLVLLTAGRLSFLHVQQRVYFPFERRSRVRREPMHVSQLPLKGAAAEEAFVLLTEVIIHQYIRLHKKKRFQPHARKLIWTGNGNKYGIGDRFRGIVHAYLCAVLSERVFIIKWTEPFPLSVIFKSAAGVHVMYDPKLDGPDSRFEPEVSKSSNAEHYSQNSAGVVENATLQNPRISYFPWCNCTLTDLGLLLSANETVELRSERPPSLRRLFVSLSANSDLPASLSLASLVREWRESPGATGDDALYAQIFKSILRPSREFLRMLARQEPELRSFVPPELRYVVRIRGATVAPRHVSVHGRVGYGLNESQKYPRRFDLNRLGGNLQMVAECLAEEASAVADEMDHPDPQRFYLACDTPELAKLFKAALRKRNREAVIVEAPGPKVHSNAMQPGSLEDRERFLYAAADLFFLSAGDALVSLPSGFANLAKWFGEIPHRTLSIRQCAKKLKRKEFKSNGNRNW